MIIMDIFNISIYDLQNIFNFCNFKSQLYLSSSCKFFNSNLLITDLYNINNNVRLLLNDKILKQSKYKYVTKLDASDNEKIKNVSQMASTLKNLCADGNCGIDQNGIKDLHLTELYAYDNEKIKNVSQMASTLKILYADGNNCGIDQNGIKDLHLTKLCASNNEKIKDVSQMASTLKILDASYYCGIDQNGIKNLHLTELYAYGNEKIKDVSQMASTLKILYV